MTVSHTTDRGLVIASDHPGAQPKHARALGEMFRAGWPPEASHLDTLSAEVPVRGFNAPAVFTISRKTR